MTGRLGAVAPRGWRNLLVQVVLLGSFTFVYALTGLYGRAHAQDAVANARGLLHLEQTLGIAWEQELQHRLLRAPHVFLEVADHTYLVSQFVISTAFLLWLYARRHERFLPVRNALLAANYVSVVVLFVYPLAPPRMLPGSGLADTLRANALNLHTPVIDALNNPYSAMPSLHASYALVLGAAGTLVARHRWAKALWALYPLLVTVSVIGTGNHFVLDVAGGALALIATPLVSLAAAGIAGRRGRVPGDRVEHGAPGRLA